MSDIIARWTTIAKDLFSRLSTGKKVLLGVGVALLATAAAVVGVVARHDPFTVLYTDLAPEDSQAVTKKLGELGVPYQLSDDRSTVLVPQKRLHSSRMELAKEGLPGGDVVGFERFDGATFGMSSYVQRVQFVRALQGELTRSIQRIKGVKRARVHISIPPKKTFLEEQEPPKASVVVELERGKELAKAESRGIAHLVASAVEGLDVKQVTIVDTKGRFLHRPEDVGSDTISSTLLEMQRSIESEYEKRVVDLLVPVVGAGKVIAKVTAEIDSSRVNTMEESYDADRAVPQASMKTDESSSGSRPNPIGIPGSRANLPGTEVQNPPIPMATTSSDKSSANMSYAIPRKVQRTDKPSGGIKRITVAVLVDGHYANGAGAGTFTPRSEEELKRLRDLVATAVGFDSQRRDSITVSSLPFRTDDIAPVEEEPPAFDWQLFAHNLTRNGLLATVLLLFFFLVLRPFLRWAAASDVERELARLPTTVSELEAARQDQGILALAKEIPVLEDPEPLEKQEEAELTKKIVDRMTKYPKKGLRIVQEWVEEDTRLAAPEPVPLKAA